MMRIETSFFITFRKQKDLKKKQKNCIKDKKLFCPTKFSYVAIETYKLKDYTTSIENMIILTHSDSIN